MMSKKLTFSEILKEKPKRYQITNDRKLVFELENGEEVELACDYCDNPLWDIGVKKDEERLAFRIVCHNCFRGIYLLWIEPEQKKAK